VPQKKKEAKINKAAVLMKQIFWRFPLSYYLMSSVVFGGGTIE